MSLHSVCIVARALRSIRHATLRRLPIVAVVLVLAIAPPALAGFHIGNNAGAQGGNDTLAKVVEELNEYNGSHNPDLDVNITLLDKSDNAGFAYDGSNGFHFWADANQTVAINSASALHDLSEAYFTYDGPANLAYYSAKGASTFGFSLFAFAENALNHLDLVGTTKDISHVSFWTTPQAVPEPGSLAVWGGLTVAAAAIAVRRCKA